MIKLTSNINRRAANFIWIIILLPTIFLLVSCENGNDSFPPGNISSIGPFHNEVDEKNFLALLDEENIIFRIRDDGAVDYPSVEKARVLGILRRVNYGNQLSRNKQESILVTSSNEKKYYIEEFEKRGISYWVIKLPGIENQWNLLYWQTDGPKVDQIQQELALRR